MERRRAPGSWQAPFEIRANTVREIDLAFATLVREQAGALLISTVSFFTSRCVQLATLAARRGVPTIAPVCDFVEAGLLMSYGTRVADTYRQVGECVGRGAARPFSARGSLPLDGARTVKLATDARARRARLRSSSWEATLKRRQFITLLGGAAAWPLGARAQQPTLPVVGYLTAVSHEFATPGLRALRQGLSEAGYVEGRNVAIEVHGADGDYDRLQEMAADLVRRRVSVIVTPGVPATTAAKAATAAVPIIFQMGADPAAFGFVASLKSAGRQSHRRRYARDWIGAKASGAAARAGPIGHHHGADCQPGKSFIGARHERA
jgi:hypothetical protein